MKIELGDIPTYAKREDGVSTSNLTRRWYLVHNHFKEWYAKNIRSSIYADYLMCKRDAERGDERAKQYMAKLAEFRLMGEE